MNIKYIPLDKITIPPRIRQRELITGQEFTALKKDISTHGLLNPITVTQDYELLAGFRRLKCFRLLGEEKIPAHVLSASTQIDKLIIELIENKDRKNFSWQEEVEAKGRLFNLLRKKERISVERFAQDYLSQSKALTSCELQIYNAAKKNPEVYTSSESKSIALEKVVRARAAAVTKEMLDRDEECLAPEQKGKLIKPKLWNSAELLLFDLEEHSVDICVSDPPYGIGIERKKGKDIFKETNYDNNWEECEKILELVISRLQDVMKPGGHVYFFCDVRFLQQLEHLFRGYNFSVCPTPLFWVKEGLKIATAALYYPMRQYECILMAFAPGEKRKLEITGESDVLVHQVVNHKDRTHPLEKPVQLYADLIARSSRKGDTFIDPFCGTGNSLIAGMRLGLKCFGSEIEEEYRNITKVKIKEEG
jgi:ParB family chromosome partitioning protein